MLAARASRLLGLGGSSSSSANPTQRTLGDRLSEPQRLARWKIFTLKLLWVLDAFGRKRRTQAVLGEDSYRKIFQEARTREEKDLHHNRPLTTIINGEIVGKPLKPGDGEVLTDPAMCSHPSPSMKRRGNKMKWWTCVQCQSRWERRSMEEQIPEGPPRGIEMMMQGTSAGSDFNHIYETRKEYCKWVLLTAAEGVEEATPQLLRLATYIRQRETAEASGWLQEPEAFDLNMNDIEAESEF